MEEYLLYVYCCLSNKVFTYLIISYAFLLLRHCHLSYRNLLQYFLPTSNNSSANINCFQLCKRIRYFCKQPHQYLHYMQFRF